MEFIEGLAHRIGNSLCADASHDCPHFGISERAQQAREPSVVSGGVVIQKRDNASLGGANTGVAGSADSAPRLRNHTRLMTLSDFRNRSPMRAIVYHNDLCPRGAKRAKRFETVLQVLQAVNRADDDAGLFQQLNRCSHSGFRIHMVRHAPIISRSQGEVHRTDAQSLRSFVWH